MKKLDKLFFGDVLKSASHEMAEKQGRDIIFAAPLANLVQKMIRSRLANENLQLDGRVYGQALFPHLSPVEHAGLKFRNFLEAFPDLVEVFRGPSGDMVRIVQSGQAQKVEESLPRYRELLTKAMRELTEIRDESLVPGVQLSKWFKKHVPEFDPKRLGADSFLDWLEKQSDLVEVSHREFGGRICLLERKTVPDTAKIQTNTPLGYLLVDSVDMLSALHALLGAKPSAQQLPDWGQLLNFVRKRFPADEWKGRYFMTLGRNPTDSTDGFKAYLEAVGYKVIQLAIDSEPIPLEMALQERSQVNREAVAKMIQALAGQNAHVLAVTHSDAMTLSLSRLLERKSAQSVVGVVGFPERMAEGILCLKQSGLVVLDADRDVKLFKQSIPRRQLISPEAFDPTHFL
jgi:putative heme uptake system protein